MKSIKLRREQRLGAVLAVGRGCGIKVALTGLMVAGALAGGRAAEAQNTGSVFGSVQDKTGAVVPKATVVITDTER